MNESDARDALLVRAYETASRSHVGDTWTEADRDWATGAARQVEGERASVDAFIARRARLGAERIAARERAAARAQRMLVWRPWIGRVVVPLALAAGVASDAIGTSQRVNLLAPPLLALLAWNLAVYLVLAVRSVVRMLRGERPAPGPIAALVGRWSHGVAPPHRVDRLSEPLQAFVADWAQKSAPLTAARVAAILHAAAAAFAAGALIGLYVRGLILEYRAGWESTFLDASAVHTLLSLVLGPASRLTGIALADTTALEALRMPQAGGENAAPWIHLYAVTILLVVVAPRLLLAGWQVFAQRRLAARFPLSLDDAYFRGLARMHAGAGATVRVAPYGFRPSAEADEGLAALCARVLGPRTVLSWAPVVAFGDEDAGVPVDDAPVAPDARIALFSLAATPETENHGVFVDALAARGAGTVPLVVLVDESAFRRRFDPTGPTGAARLEERRAAWRRMLAQRNLAPVFADLERRDFAQAQAALQEAIDRASGPVHG